jgi:hypothetical protein
MYYALEPVLWYMLICKLGAEVVTIKRSKDYPIMLNNQHQTAQDYPIMLNNQHQTVHAGTQQRGSIILCKLYYMPGCAPRRAHNVDWPMHPRPTVLVPAPTLCQRGRRWRLAGAYALPERKKRRARWC